MRKVFNLGFSKTGTSSLEEALAILGYRVARGHWRNHYAGFLYALCVNGDHEEILRFTRSFEAFSDGPWGGGTRLYATLADAYPTARFLLTIRDSDSWYQSLETMLTAFDRNLETALSSHAEAGFWPTVYWFRRVLGIEELAGNRDRIVACYEAYNREVTAHFERLGRPLLVLDVAAGQGWEPLCRFLDHVVPERPFPWRNIHGEGWLERKFTLEVQMREHLRPTPPPLPVSPRPRAAALRGDDRHAEAAAELGRLLTEAPADSSLALEAAYAAFAAGEDGRAAAVLEPRMADLFEGIDLRDADIGDALLALIRISEDRWITSACGLAWLIGNRGGNLRTADPAAVVNAVNLAASLHADRGAVALEFPKRLGDCFAGGSMPDGNGAGWREIASDMEADDPKSAGNRLYNKLPELIRELVSSAREEDVTTLHRLVARVDRPALTELARSVTVLVSREEGETPSRWEKPRSAVR